MHKFLFVATQILTSTLDLSHDWHCFDDVKVAHGTTPYVAVTIADATENDKAKQEVVDAFLNLVHETNKLFFYRIYWKDLRHQSLKVPRERCLSAAVAVSGFLAFP